MLPYPLCHYGISMNFFSNTSMGSCESTGVEEHIKGTIVFRLVFAHCMPGCLANLVVHFGSQVRPSWRKNFSRVAAVILVWNPKFRNLKGCQQSSCSLKIFIFQTPRIWSHMFHGQFMCPHFGPFNPHLSPFYAWDCRWRRQFVIFSGSYLFSYDFT